MQGLKSDEVLRDSLIELSILIMWAAGYFLLTTDRPIVGLQLFMR